MKEFLKLNIDPAEVIELFPDLDGKPGSDSKHKSLKGKDLENALKALIEYLLELRRRFGTSNAAKAEGGGEDSSKSEASQVGAQEDTRSQRNVQQQLELIDTTLLKCYLQVHCIYLFIINVHTQYNNKIHKTCISILILI